MMRLRNRSSSERLISLRSSLVWLALIALCFVAGLTALGVMLCLIGSLYVALNFGALLLGKHQVYSTTSLIRRCQMVQANPHGPLTIAATTYLIFHYVWHLWLLMMLNPSGFDEIWHQPLAGAMTLAQVEHTVILAFTILLVVSFWSRAYGHGTASRTDCLTTAVLVAFFVATHLAVP